MLGAAQPDALGAVAQRSLRVFGVVSVGPHTEAAELVGPRQQLGQPLVVEVGRHGGDLADVDVAGGAVDRHPLALLHLLAGHGEAAVRHVDLDRGGARHGRLAELPGDERGVAGAAAARGEDAHRGEHAVDVVGLGLGPHEQDVAPVGRPPLGQVRVEGHHADGRTG